MKGDNDSNTFSQIKSTSIRNYVPIIDLSNILCSVMIKAENDLTI